MCGWKLLLLLDVLIIVLFEPQKYRACFTKLFYQTHKCNNVSSLEKQVKTMFLRYTCLFAQKFFCLVPISKLFST